MSGFSHEPRANGSIVGTDDAAGAIAPSGTVPRMHRIDDTARSYGASPRYEVWMDQLQRIGEPVQRRRQHTFAPVPADGAVIIALPVRQTGRAA